LQSKVIELVFGEEHFQIVQIKTRTFKFSIAVINFW